MQPGKITVRFVSGIDRVSTYPDIARRAGFKHRFAIVQDTSVDGSPDMVFDEALWRSLTGYATATSSRSNLTVVEHLKRGSVVEIPLERFLQQWTALPEDQKSPPQALIARSGGGLTLCMVTDYWCNVGGPMPYHDSYTYSIYTKDRVDRDVTEFLKQAPDRNRWHFAPDVLAVSEGPAPSMLQRAMAWLR